MALSKTPEEIRCIQEACLITDELFLRVLESFPFASERELALFIRKEIRSRGLREAFAPIVTSGPRAGNEIHPKYTNETMRGFVIIDLGVRVGGYCSDMTRTIFVGKPTKKDRAYYSLVLAAKGCGERAVRVGEPVAAADAAARDSMGRYKKYFIHTLGHGVGRRIHEKPIIYFKRPSGTFMENMVITIEPGIYIPKKLGIRIEDTYLITKKGPKALTKSPQSLIVV